MDTISTALTTAWLDAVRRSQSAAYQNFLQQVPQAKAPRTDRTLSDVIESALQDAGAKPAQPSGATTAVGAASPTSTRIVDRSV
jgi:hypothetical protein